MTIPNRTHIPDSVHAATPVTVLNIHYLSSTHDWLSRESDGRNPYLLDTHLRQARLAAEAGIDILFQAYFAGVNRERVRRGPWNPPFEPFQLAALTAAAVPSITIMPTVSTLHTHPFTTARALASLDRISEGRAALNLVSSFRSGSAADVKRSVSRHDRHAQSREYIEVLRALWASWPPEASIPDRANQRYIRDDLITDVGHVGAFYEQQGPLDLPPLTAAFPPLMLPAGSLGGLQLAARNADYVFGGAPTLTAAKRLRASLRAATSNAGREASAVRLILGCYLQIEPSRDRTGSRWSAGSHTVIDVANDHDLLALQRALAQDIPKLGLDKLALGDPLPSHLFPSTPEETLHSLGARASALWELAQRPHLTLRDFLTAALRQGEHPTFRGSASDIADELVHWIQQGGADGFQFILGNRFDALCEVIIPSLQRIRTQTAT